jgi:hypothetical protein
MAATVHKFTAHPSQSQDLRRHRLAIMDIYLPKTARTPTRGDQIEVRCKRTVIKYFVKEVISNLQVQCELESKEFALFGEYITQYAEINKIRVDTTSKTGLIQAHHPTQMNCWILTVELNERPPSRCVVS